MAGENEELTFEQKGEAIIKFAGKEPAGGLHERDLDDALYAANETGAWPDDVTVSVQQAMMCWRLVEQLRRQRLPEDLKM